MFSVSVCIPTYNQSEYLPIAVRSAFNQSIKPAEIIIYDDCSTDETQSVLDTLAQDIPILKIFRQLQNVGIARNTDQCLRAANGEFIVRLDSDDVLGFDFIKELANGLVDHPDAGYAHAAVTEIDQYGNQLRKRQLSRTYVFEASPDALRSAVAGYKVTANILMFRKEALQKVGYLSGRPDYVEDYHLSVAIAATGFGNVYVDKQLAFYRVWIDTGKVRQRRKILEVMGLVRVFGELLEPAFSERSWSLQGIMKRRKGLACRQANCLGWDVYTEQEKDELYNALLLLSNSPRLKIVAKIYRIDSLNILGFIDQFKRTIFFKVKDYYLSFKSAV